MSWNRIWTGESPLDRLRSLAQCYGALARSFVRSTMLAHRNTVSARGESLALLALVAAASVGSARTTSLCAGDAVVENVNIETKPDLSFDLDAVVAKAKEIDPIKGAQLEQKIQSGDLVIVEFSDRYNLGFHDYNTIALEPRFGPTAMAVALLHEFWHVEQCNGGPSNGGVTNAPQPSSCSACTHLVETAKSWTQLTAALCNPPCPEPIDIAGCEGRDRIREAARDGFRRCSASTCSSKPTWSSLASWSAECFCCTL